MMQQPASPQSSESSGQFNDLQPKRSLGQSLRRGWSKRCPACGSGLSLYKYLKVKDHCSDCGESLFHHQADDAPPYFTILIVAHIMVPIAGIVEKTYKPNVELQMVLWPFMAVLLCLWFLPRVKGALIGLQWANYMHGFGGQEANVEASESL